MSTAAQSQPVERASDRFLSQSGSSIEELVEAALDREPGLQASRRKIDAAEGRERQGALRPNPTLSVSRNEEIDGTDNNTMIGVAWPLDLWRKPARVAAAERGTDVARAELLDRERLLAAEIRRAAGDLLAAVRSLRVIEDLLEASRRFAELVDARVREGATPTLERGLVQVEVSRIASELALSEALAETAILEVKRLSGLMPDSQLALREDLERAVRASARNEDRRSIDERPDVKAAEARVAATGALQDLARREGRADASLVASYSRADMGFPQLGFGPTGGIERVRGIFHRIELGMSWQVPLLNRNQGEVAALQSERAAAQQEAVRVRLAAAAELASAEVRERKALEAVKIYSRDVLAQARENLDVLRESYELGRYALLDVIDGERRYLEVEEGYTEALLELYQAQVDLRRARGGIQ
ncbi:MAG: TolC family protein [Vicinamibacteria bacterium]